MLRTLMLVAVALTVPVQRDVPFERLQHADREPQNWLTYSGTYQSQRHTLLTQITPANVRNLELQWAFQSQSREKFEATPIVVDGVMTVSPPNTVVALTHSRAGVGLPAPSQK
jgi:glucose dehydrogenase